MKNYKVGILGATGMVGQRFITLLSEHPWFKEAKEYLKNHNGTISTLDITAHESNVYVQNSGSLSIGAQLTIAGGGTNFWAGTVNDLRIYNRALTTDEASALLGEISTE